MVRSGSIFMVLSMMLLPIEMLIEYVLIEYVGYFLWGRIAGAVFG